MRKFELHIDGVEVRGTVSRDEIGLVWEVTRATGAYDADVIGHTLEVLYGDLPAMPIGVARVVRR